jgi:tRNA acetyltransferase TAN1
MQPTEKFDLIVTFEEDNKACQPHETLKTDEIEMALQKQGKFFYIKESEIYNVLLVELRSDPFKIAEKLENTPTFPYKVIPIVCVVPTRLDCIQNKVINMCRQKIKPGQSCRVRCNLRGTRHIESWEVLVGSIYGVLLEKLNIHINEDKPDWMVQIQVVGENTGISLSSQFKSLKLWNNK